MGWAHVANLDASILDELWYMISIVELLTYLVVMHEIFSIETVCTNGNSDKIQKDSDFNLSCFADKTLFKTSIQDIGFVVRCS